MTTNDLGPPRPTHRPDDPPVTVRMDGDHVVIHLNGALDRDGTDAVAESVNGAIDAGCPTVLDLVRSDDADRQGSDFVHLDPTGSTPRTRPVVTVVGTGLLQVPTAMGSWTIDVAAGRVCTQPIPAEPRFVPARAWVPIRSFTITARTVAAIGAAGRRIVAAVA